METNMIQKLEAAPANQDGMVTSATKVSLKSILTLSIFGDKITPLIHLVHFFMLWLQIRHNVLIAIVNSLGVNPIYARGRKLYLKYTGNQALPEVLGEVLFPEEVGHLSVLEK